MTVTIFTSGPNNEHPVIDLLNMAECLVMSVLVMPGGGTIACFGDT